MTEAVEEPTTQPVHDPVCHKEFPAEEASGSIEYEGFTYYFCSDECEQKFKADPEAVLAAEGAHHQRPSG